LSEERRRYLRDMLDELDRHFDEFERSVEEAIKASVNTGQRAFSRPVVTGMAMGFGPEGKPRIQFFGDNLIGPDGFRAPIYEQVVDEKEGMLRLVFELPGIEKEDVQVSALEEKVTLEAVPDSGAATYRNGLLEVVFKLRDNTNKGYRRVRVV